MLSWGCFGCHEFGAPPVNVDPEASQLVPPRTRPGREERSKLATPLVTDLGLWGSPALAATLLLLDDRDGCRNELNATVPAVGSGV